MPGDITISSGGILYYRLYDVSWETDLLKVQEKVKEFKRLGMERRLFSKAFEFANPPVTLRLKGFQAQLDEKPHEVLAYGKVYDYGVVSIIFYIRMDGSTLAGFEATAKHIRNTGPFKDRFGQELDLLLADIRETMTGVAIQPIEEEYTVYYVAGTEPAVDAYELLAGCDLGRLMLDKEGEPPPGRDTYQELLNQRFSYSDRDLVIVSWENALVLEPSGLMDIPDLLEFATAQLLELRVYDQFLDRELDRIYTRITPRVSPSIWKIKQYEELATKLMRTITEITEITERVDNSLKVTDDVYYAKVYSAAVTLFKVKQWENNIRRKIDIAARVYDMVYRDISNKRIELLEAVIVALIALEILIFVFRG